MSQAAALVWLRHDLRLADQPALTAALQRGGPVVPVFIWAPEEEGDWPPGGASGWWLHQSLKALDGDLRRLGSRLVLRRGESQAELLALAKATGADTVVWNRRYEPAIIARDARIKEQLRAAGLAAESFNGALLHEPWTVQNQSGLEALPRQARSRRATATAEGAARTCKMAGVARAGRLGVGAAH
jgi:deoxyribodipyrimidine photo-lyase